VTFLQLQSDVMSRVNYTSTDARALIKIWLNQRYREVVSSVNLARTRRGLVTFTTVSGNSYITATGIAKLLDLYDAVNLKRPLEEVTVDEIRAMDPASETTGHVTHFAIQKHVADSITLLVYPQPDSVYALTADALIAGTDMTADADIPTIPTDFHDILVHGAHADALNKLEKPRLAEAAEKRFEKRVADLRYFIIKNAHLHQAPQDNTVVAHGRRTWPYSNMI
jgi:hypothetical protein